MSGPNSGSSDLCVWVFQFVCLYLCVCICAYICICAPVNWAGESTCHWLLRFKARQTEVWYKSEIKTQFEIKVAPMHKSFVTRPKCLNTPFNVSWSSSQASRSTFIVCRLLSPFNIRWFWGWRNCNQSRNFNFDHLSEFPVGTVRAWWRIKGSLGPKVPLVFRVWNSII